MDAKLIGKNISYLRKTKNLTQFELAQKLFVSNKAISKWETGEGVPDINNILQIAKMFNVSVEDLINKDIFSVTKPETLNSNEVMEADVLSSKINEPTNADKMEQKESTKQSEQSKTKSNAVSAKLIVSYVMAGVSFISSIFVSQILGIVLAIVGLVLAQKEASNGKIAKILNIVALGVGALILLANIILLIVFGSYFRSIISFFTGLMGNLPFSFNV